MNAATTYRILMTKIGNFRGVCGHRKRTAGIGLQTILVAGCMLAGAGYEMADAAPVYRCRDAKGGVTLTDKPCAPGQTTENVSERETAGERASAYSRKQGEIPAGAVEMMRANECKLLKHQYNGLDKRLLTATQRNDEAAKKQIIDDRRRYGARMTELGC